MFPLCSALVTVTTVRAGASEVRRLTEEQARAEMLAGDTRRISAGMNERRAYVTLTGADDSTRTYEFPCYATNLKG